ncbi:hypothetical protein DL95DRAFT_507722 [Leptodontidium sp. 2 PMI_412]|nr:hypothetical protein DL95DRAFT_507722 [Leptodontidium sp. 2 PMI_412]
MASTKLCVAVGDSAIDSDGSGPVYMDWSVGIFWIPKSPDAQRLRSPKNSGWRHDSITRLEIVLSRPRGGGLGLSAFDGIPQLASGEIGAFADPSCLALHTSRCLDDPTLKIFMRDPVIVSEYLVYIPAAAIFFRRLSKLQGVNTWSASIELTAILVLANVGFLRYSTNLQPLFDVVSRDALQG